MTDDDLSRLILLDFHYFSTPYDLPELRLATPSKEIQLRQQTRGNGVILIFLGEKDPFNDVIREEIMELETLYLNDPIRFILVSQNGEDYMDLDGFSRKSLGIMTYPSYFVIDHNYRLRGSAEGIYPSLLSDDFKKILDTLIFDIKSPGIVNTLK